MNRLSVQSILIYSTQLYTVCLHLQTHLRVALRLKRGGKMSSAHRSTVFVFIRAICSMVLHLLGVNSNSNELKNLLNHENGQGISID
jgi:hypothetical protein